MVNNIKVSATFLVAISIVFCVCSTVCAGTYSGGDGLTAATAYQIATAGDMQEIGANADDWDKYFVMTADIDLSAYDGQDGNPAFNIIAPFWIPNTSRRDSPPEDLSPRFTGTFDGNEHVIYNFSYTATEAGYIGIFGRVGDGEQGLPPTVIPGTIKNLGLENASVSVNTAPAPGSYAGSLAGSISYGSTISKCYVQGGVGGDSGGCTGGLVGVSYDSIITNCYSNAHVGGSRAGGLVGENNFGMISNCYATGNVGDPVWGSDEMIGGLAGYNSGGSIEYCYSTGQVGAGIYAGGLVGSNYLGNYTACFWDADLNPSLSDAGDFIGGIDLAGVIGETTANMQMRTTFTSVGWDFAVETINGEDDIWTIDEGASYPYLGLGEYGDGESNDLDIYYVDGSALGNNDGSSWTDAFTELQSALDAAVAGDEIRVADGTYKPSVEVGGSGERYRTFQLKTGVTVRGGFAGWGAVDPNDRKFELYETILSGDLNGDDNPNTPVEDLRDDPSRTENCFHVFYHPADFVLDPNAILDGFTITGGNTGGSGGGMYNYYNSSPTVTNCTFRGNLAHRGGGMYNGDHNNPTVTNCTFSGNLADDGGGIFNEYCNLTVTGCSFVGNSAVNQGGGMYNAGGSPTVTGCTFSGNSADYQGSGMFNISSSPTVTGCTFSNNSPTHGFGGGMYNNNSDPEVMGCTFIGNSCDAGGGMYNYQDSSPIVSDCTFRGNLTMASGSGMFNEDSSPRVTNCIFSDNSSLIGSGGGMFNVSSGPEVISCTFSGNSAHFEGGGMYNYNSDLTVTDCTFSGNSAVHGGGMCNELSDAIITNCTFSGNSADLYGGGMQSRDDSNPIVINCTFSGNSANIGGGVYNELGDAIITNCTFSGNSANLSGGGIFNKSSDLTVISNCIFWGDTASGGHEITNAIGSLVVSYCDIQGGCSGGTNIIDVDPMFVRTPDDGGDGWGDDPATEGVDEGANDDYGDLRLQSGSLCIDAGDNGAVTEATDLDGRIRIVDGDGDGTVTVDMGAYESQVIYVDRDAVGANNGGSWGDAFVNLYDAFGVAVWGDEIRVAGGTYKPDTDGLGDVREASFALVNGVTVKGGYAGFGAASPDERDIELYETILSGDLLGDDDSVMLFGDLFTPQYIDPNRAENCYHVFYHPDGLGLDPNAVLDGFTITGGNAIGASFSQYSYGGGMCNESGSPTVTNCIFRSNLARDGAGIYNGNSSPTVKNCLFSDNLGLGVAGEGGLGGGMYNYNNSNPTVSDSIFSGNSAGWLGGGMCNYDSSPTVTGCIFSGNSAGWFGGGMCNGIGSPTVMNCVFIGNTADYGGGMFNEGSSPILTNCTLSYNQASQGGGIFNRHHESWGTVTRSFVSLFNCILWGNTASTEGNEIAVIDSSTITVNYCDVEGDEAGIYDDGSGNTINWGSGNIDVDPMFVDADSGYLRLLPGSLCIDAGDNLAVTEATDLDGHTRVADGNCDGAAVVDMGAYEFDWLYLGDFAGGCDVDLSDFAVLAESWQGSNAGVDIAPYHDGDGAIDLGELMVLAENWLECYTTPEPLDVSLDMDNSWMYQNLPGKVASNLTASVSIIDDPLGNISYSYQWEIISPSDVTIEPVTVSGGGSSDGLWIFAAPSCNEPAGISDSGEVFTVKVTVTGNLGNTGSAEVEFGIALLGDVNNDTVVNGADRGIINTFWITGAAGIFGLGDCDVNCDGVVNGADRGITNTIWDGTLGSNSITAPCALR